MHVAAAAAAFPRRARALRRRSLRRPGSSARAPTWRPLRAHHVPAHLRQHADGARSLASSAPQPWRQDWPVSLAQSHEGCQAAAAGPLVRRRHGCARPRSTQGPGFCREGAAAAPETRPGATRPASRRAGHAATRTAWTGLEARGRCSLNTDRASQRLSMLILVYDGCLRPWARAGELATALWLRCDVPPRGAARRVAGGGARASAALVPLMRAAAAAAERITTARRASRPPRPPPPLRAGCVRRCSRWA
jgi:hypothetical protein